VLQDEQSLSNAREAAYPRSSNAASCWQSYGIRITRVHPLAEDEFEEKQQTNAPPGPKHSLHFPPGFVLRIPFEMMNLAKAVDLSFSSVTYGKYSVQLVVRDFLHCFLQADEHGAVLDFVAYYQRGHPVARPWLEQMVRLVCMAVRSELKRCNCAVMEAKVSADKSSACCSYHHAVMDDLPECNITPLCATCLLMKPAPLRRVVHFQGSQSATGVPAPLTVLPSSIAAATATHLHPAVPASAAPYCEPTGHSMSAAVMCLSMKPEAAESKIDATAEQLAQLLGEVASMRAKLDGIKSTMDKLDEIKSSTDDIKSSTDAIKSSTDDIKSSTDAIKSTTDDIHVRDIIVQVVGISHC